MLISCSTKIIQNDVDWIYLIPRRHLCQALWQGWIRMRGISWRNGNFLDFKKSLPLEYSWLVALQLLFFFLPFFHFARLCLPVLFFSRVRRVIRNDLTCFIYRRKFCLLLRRGCVEEKQWGKKDKNKEWKSDKTGGDKMKLEKVWML